MTESTVDSRLAWIGGGLFGFGMGAVLDVLVFHLILQEHHLLSNWYDPDTPAGFQQNIYYDGLFALALLGVAVVGIGFVWWVANGHHRRLSTLALIGTVFFGAGVFNVFDGIVSHYVLDIHDVVHSTTVWNPPWVAVSVVLLVVGGTLFTWGRRRAVGRDDVF